MKYVVVSLAIFCSCLSTAIMSYVSMATPVGPWIAPVIVMFGILFFSYIMRWQSYESSLVYVVLSSSIGGILATAFGFTVPTLYFLDSYTFYYYMASPMVFYVMLSLLAFVSGWYGIWIANVLECEFVNSDEMTFPIGRMINKMIVSYENVQQAWHMMVGFLVTMLTQLFCYVVGLFLVSYASLMSFFSSIFFMQTYVAMWPLLCAIGFVTGFALVMPLAIGGLMKMAILHPIHTLWFGRMTFFQFLMAFCGGIVLFSTIKMFFALFLSLVKKKGKVVFGVPILKGVRHYVFFEGVMILLALVFLLSCVGFSYGAQGYLIIGTFICAYQMNLISAKIGLAQLGRFATFVLMPALFFFQLDPVQITVVSLFVEAVSGVAVDALRGRKIIQLSRVDYNRAVGYQYVGLIMSSLVVGVVFLALITKFGLGSSELFAQRAQARQLLVHIGYFDCTVVALGFLCAYVLTFFDVSAMLVLSGLLMPFGIALGLIIGGLLARTLKEQRKWYSFFSGVFTASSMYMLMRALF